jgi:hypothetical protein
MKFAKLQFVNEKQCANKKKIEGGGKRKSPKSNKKKNINGTQRFTYVRQKKKQGNANLNKRWGLLGTLFKLRSPYEDSISRTNVQQPRDEGRH